MNRWFATLIAGLLVLGTSAAMVLREEDSQKRAPLPPQPFKKHVDYLMKYGYFDNIVSKSVGPIPTKEQLKEAVETMQRFTGLPVTGELDEDTVKIMNQPRCGVKDINPISRYNTAGTNYKWDTNDLRYTILNYTPDLPNKKTRSAFTEAFQIWSDVTPITFTRTRSEKAEIRLSFGAGVHSSDPDDPVFDGEWGTLAHAFYPKSGWGELNGDIHFDEDETFEDGEGEGANLLSVTTHEIGHALGLAHSGVRDAIMWPSYTRYYPGFALHQDDIDGIQSLYGEQSGLVHGSAIQGPSSYSYRMSTLGKLSAGNIPFLCKSSSVALNVSSSTCSPSSKMMPHDH